MKKILLLIPLLLMVFLLSGCDNERREDFDFYNDFLESEKLLFDQYFVFFEDQDNGIVIYGVRDSEVVDNDGDEFISYIVKKDNNQEGLFRFSCGINVLDSGTMRNYRGTEIDLVSGEEVYDYCLEDIFTILLPDGTVEAREIKRDVNDSDITWLDVEGLENRNIFDHFSNNLALYLMIVGIGVLFSLLFTFYKYFYQKNYNNFTTGKKVRKLPSAISVGIILLVTMILSYVILFTEYNYHTYNQSNNLYDYTLSEQRTEYLEIFVNDGYTLLEKNGDLEAYVNVISNDQVAYFIVVVDGDIKYIVDEIYFDYPGAANIDSYRVDLRRKDGLVGGEIYGYFIAGYKLIDDVNTEVFVYSAALTEKVDGETVFVDYLDANNNWTEYFMNRKGYYQVNMGRAEAFYYNYEE